MLELADGFSGGELPLASFAKSAESVLDVWRHETDALYHQLHSVVMDLDVEAACAAQDTGDSLDRARQLTRELRRIIHVALETPEQAP